jgi:hypothetical protein
VDRPLVKAILPARVSDESFATTRLGLFNLLGKATLYCARNNREYYAMCNLASLLQHLTVPQDAETLCPYVDPLLGGDGAFTEDVAFL